MTDTGGEAWSLPENIHFLVLHRTHSSEIIVYGDATAESVMKQVKKALLVGCAVEYPDKHITVWYSDDWIVKDGTHDPIWHSDGERIRKVRYEVTRDDKKNAIVNKIKIGEFWGKYLEGDEWPTRCRPKSAPR